MTSNESISELVSQSLARRARAEKRFQWYGRIAIMLGVLAVLVLFADIIGKGHKAFLQTQIQLNITFDPIELGLPRDPEPEDFQRADYDRIIQLALYERFAEVSDRDDLRMLRALPSSGSFFQLRQHLSSNPDQLGTTQPVWLIVDEEAHLIEVQRAVGENEILDIRDGGDAPVPLRPDGVPGARQGETGDRAAEFDGVETE